MPELAARLLNRCGIIDGTIDREAVDTHIETQLAPPPPKAMLKAHMRKAAAAALTTSPVPSVTTASSTSQNNAGTTSGQPDMRQIDSTMLQELTNRWFAPEMTVVAAMLVRR